MERTPASPVTRERVRFGEFELDLRTGELWLNTDPVELRPLATGALVALVENAGRIVSREELRRRLWPDVVIAWDQSLNQCILQVRRALRDRAGAPVFVETVPRQGYRFVAPVFPAGDLTGRRAASHVGARSRLIAFLAGAAMALVVPAVLLAICLALAGR
jgi:DNA-binding winged helix-turn-helix (wHTH) protein